MEVWHLIVACLVFGAAVGIVAFIRGCAVGWEDCMRYQEAVESGGIDLQQELMVRAWYRKSRPSRDMGTKPSTTPRRLTRVNIFTGAISRIKCNTVSCKVLQCQEPIFI